MEYASREQVAGLVERVNRLEKETFLVERINTLEKELRETTQRLDDEMAKIATRQHLLSEIGTLIRKGGKA